MTGIPKKLNPAQEGELAFKWGNMYNSNEQNALDREQKEAQLEEIARHNQATERNNTYQPDFFTKADYNEIVREAARLSTQRIKLTEYLSEAKAELDSILSIPGAENSPAAQTAQAKVESLRKQIRDTDARGQELETQKQKLSATAKANNSTSPKDVLFGTSLPPVGQGSAQVSPGILTLPSVSSGVSGDDIRPVSPALSFNDPLSADTHMKISAWPLTRTMPSGDQKPQTPAQANGTKQTLKKMSISLPREMFYDPEKDADIAPEKVFDNARLKELMIKYGASPEDVLTLFRKYGYKYKR